MAKTITNLRPTPRTLNLPGARVLHLGPKGSTAAVSAPVEEPLGPEVEGLARIRFLAVSDAK